MERKRRRAERLEAHRLEVERREAERREAERLEAEPHAAAIPALAPPMPSVRSWSGSRLSWLSWSAPRNGPAPKPHS